jgi:hypothetical protein
MEDGCGTKMELDKQSLSMNQRHSNIMIRFVNETFYTR